jgi:hypothetical protein
MKVNRRNVVLALSLTATLIAVYFSPSAEGNDVVLSARASKVESRVNDPSNKVRSSSFNSIEVLVVRTRDWDEEEDASVFATSDWTPPKATLKPVESVEKAVAQEPQIPPVPFQVMGRYVENGKITVFLQYNDQNLVARVGDTLAESYKVEGLDGGVMTLRYLPMNVQQTLQIGGAI